MDTLHVEKTWISVCALKSGGAVPPKLWDIVSGANIPKYPTAPAYIPLVSPSSSAISSIALTFGALPYH